MSIFKKVLLGTALVLCTGISFGQKKKIDYQCYDSWKTLSSVSQSLSGKIISYEINPSVGDGVFFVYNKNTGHKFSIARGANAKVHHKDHFVVGLIKPQHDSIRKLKLDKVDDKKLPKDSLFIYWPTGDSLKKIADVKSFDLAKEGNWMAYLSHKDKRKPCKKKRCRKCKDEGKDCEKPKSNGKTMHFFNPVTGAKGMIHQVVDFFIDPKGKRMAYIRSEKGEKDSLSLWMIEFDTKERTQLSSSLLSLKKSSFDESGEQLVFLESTDTNKNKVHVLKYWEKGMNESKVILDENKAGLPQGWTISEYSGLRFSQDGTKLFVGTSEKPQPDVKDTLLPDEIAKLDIWHWKDERIQPEQLTALKRDKMKNYMGVLFLSSGKFVQLEDEEVEYVGTVNKGNANFGFGINNHAYSVERTWTYPWRSDYYFVDFETGKRSIVAEGVYSAGGLSPSGEYFTWYNPNDSSWNVSTTQMGKGKITTSNLTKDIREVFAEDVNGQPTLGYPAGNYDWTLINGKEHFIVKSQHNIWILNPGNPKASFSLVNKEFTSNREYSLVRTDPDSTYLNLESAMVIERNTTNQMMTVYTIQNVDEIYKMTKKLETNHLITQLEKAPKSDDVLLRRMSFTEYPELELTNLNFENTSKITETNPQQSEYNWGTVESVSWNAYDGKELKGLLYKPEDFDSTKQYPMIVYYYEKYSENIHYHYSPRATASIVYPTEYVSNGYIIFIPDILYEEGHPAKGAYNSIMSGTDMLIRNNNWIDSTRLGLQGQSWGGYQTAQLVTMTDRFSAAMAGAPVSNMISAYGGIRWGSGLSRMFQYETTQSRIGATIWENPELYIENSPIFGLPNVKTPLLIMHNDNDGAVPWYQGIELYMGLRRLNKPAWLLNYNGDNHNLTKLANKKDLSRRMRQFFDHYLLGKPEPEWMKTGIPAVEKGENFGFDTEK